ncbi:FxLYD domain-containing protein [Methanobacterium sp. ACI-7]|uniref:FxLYD domain-containing protein n=1 Tax=unclassified Methanobacterium TaxID=2627676 RepID=UPI0039C0731D
MRKILPIIIILLILGIVGISGCTDSSSSSSNPPQSSAAPFQIENLKVTNQGYGGYSIKGELTPNQDLSYLEMVTVWYDASGAVIDRNPLAWNMNDLKSGQKVKFSTNDYLSSDKETPAKVELLVFKGAFSGGDDSSAIYRKTIQL